MLDFKPASSLVDGNVKLGKGKESSLINKESFID